MFEDFNLEPFVEGMSDEEKTGFYKGFSKCHNVLLLAVHKTDGVYIFPREANQYFLMLSEEMSKYTPSFYPPNQKANGTPD